MRGISEKTLQQKLESLLSYQEDYELLKELIAECQELQEPWIPIDENTPKDKNFRLYCKQLGQKTGRIDEWSLGLFTHYQELPEDPETGDKNARN